MLLSFAQFEREVTGERIRDKIAASKRRGMWMGGNIPLGYDVRSRQLVINEVEAETVRTIFRRYAELGTVSSLQADLKRQGIVSKIWTSTTGNVRGGASYSRGALYYLLRNQIYLGRVPHKTESYEGQHTSIVDQALWDQVQACLSANRSGPGRGPSKTNRSILAGLLYDDRGNVMSPSHSKKRDGRRYRYYVSQALLQNNRARAGTVSRIAAEAIEQLVEGEVKRLLSAVDPTGSPRPESEARLPLREIIDRVVIYKSKVEIELAATSERKLVKTDGSEDGAPRNKIIVPVKLAYRRQGARFEDTEGRSHRQSGGPDPALVKAICRAHEWLGRFERGEVASYHALARAEGFTPSYVRGVMQLAFLAPELVEAYLDGRRRLRGGVVELLMANLSLSWRLQHASA